MNLVLFLEDHCCSLSSGVKMILFLGTGDSAANAHVWSEAEGDAAYFSTYDSAGVHEEMLLDPVRCGAYAAAIAACGAIRGGVVVDVGAGSGILSCLCAKAGARKVYAVEASASAARLLRSVVRANGCEGVVEVLQRRRP